VKEKKKGYKKKKGYNRRRKGMKKEDRISEKKIKDI